MRTTRRGISVAVLSMAMLGGGYAFLGSPLIPIASAHLKDHPRLEKAYVSLRDAREYLEAAPHDFRGHRKEAVHAIDVALDKISMAVQDADHKEGERERKVALETPPATTEHAKLREARDHCQAAHQYLKESKDDFHGHREEAMKAIHEAVHHINLCLGEKEKD